ncbi:hypothetical protein CVV26_03355 [Candidatus Kuenenbacteria bacterium HGW-Kuenenbacteria-1]|uniref:Uncharacterized protein n=1 Tax=Candidatus Kuenenbacteria bacterium HGW-Kuenenbacteria-1 TaxID=2013812 RepID=A0A2N1UMP4_9BACT|nr:MAG: hypothetical protein CVV26_03355 [Candidatus Kuenenbacteria bacterium HGW-Kuenenbacteria-1]
MLNLNEIENLKDPEVFRKTEKIVQEIIINKQIKEALKLINFLEEKAPFLQKELYQLLLVKLKLLTFSLFSELEVLDFFKKNIREILKISAEDILESVKSKIIGLPILERNSFKKELFLVLKEVAKKEKIDFKELVFLINYLKISSEEEPEEEILVKDEAIENEQQKEIWEMIKTKKQESIETQKQENIEEQLRTTNYSLPTNLNRPVFESSKPKTESIKFTHKLIGPIEELRNFTLNEFRKLGDTPQEVVQKIKEKIDILGKDSLIKKAEGIKAWQNTEINKLYLEIGRISLRKNISISEAINENISNGLLTLTLEEFEAITDLNKKLRF